MAWTLTPRSLNITLLDSTWGKKIQVIFIELTFKMHIIKVIVTLFSSECLQIGFGVLIIEYILI